MSNFIHFFGAGFFTGILLVILIGIAIYQWYKNNNNRKG